MTGFSKEEADATTLRSLALQVLGQNCRMMLQGVPEVAISKSARKNLRDFCRMCKVKRLDQISEAGARLVLVESGIVR